jgi:hypothetical protein
MRKWPCLYSKERRYSSPIFSIWHGHFLNFTLYIVIIKDGWKSYFTLCILLRYQNKWRVKLLLKFKYTIKPLWMSGKAFPKVFICIGFTDFVPKNMKSQFKWKKYKLDISICTNKDWSQISLAPDKKNMLLSCKPDDFFAQFNRNCRIQYVLWNPFLDVHHNSIF